MVYFFKVNRDEVYTYRNVQHWIDILTNTDDSEVIFLCDKEEIRKEIERRIDFCNIKYSFRETAFGSNTLNKIVPHIANDFWTNASYAHLTTFLYAEELGLEHFWNIDADDTRICLSPARASELLRIVEKTSESKLIDVYSLDMWCSRENGEHWSFGVTYTRGSKWINTLLDHCEDDAWRLDERQPRNVDGFFTYLGQVNAKKIRTFCFENLRFIHYSNDFFKRPISSGLFHWKNGRLDFPILQQFGLIDIGKIKIAANVDIINMDITDAESFQFLVNDNFETGLIQRFNNLVKEKSSD